jgi:hypothetical protein
MVKMNWDQARGGDDDFAAVGEEPTIAARYAGTCATCGQRFGVGEPIASVIVDKKPTYHHGACRHPATALLTRTVFETDMDAVGAARNEPTSRCSATTTKGRRATTPLRKASSSAARISLRPKRESSRAAPPTDGDVHDGASPRRGHLVPVP